MMKMDTTFGIREFKELRDLIYEKIGIHILDEKIYFLKKRVEKRIEELGIDSPSEYIKYLRYMDHTGKEFQNLTNSITINETYFFRNFPVLQAFAEHCLPEVLQRNMEKKQKELRILSAGCSSGEEPYTLSIILHEMVDDLRNINAKIVGIDIDESALKKAKRGIYDERSIKDVPGKYLDKHFDILPSGYSVKEHVRRLVGFHKINLFDSTNLLRIGKQFDFVFCRNVLIYFSDESRRKVVENLYMMMKPGGYIFLGYSESMTRITRAFRIKRAGNTLVYQKPM